MKTSTLRRLACGAFLTGSAWLALTALDGAAHADDGPQRPGGALGAVVEAVDQAVPDVEPTKAPEPEPTKEPAAEPSDEPARDTDGQDEQQATDEPAEEPAPADPVETVTDPVETVVEVVTTPVVVTSPTPAPVITPTPAPTPAQTSTPTQSQPETTTAPTPTPKPQVPAVEAVAVPVDEQTVVIGPVAGTATLLPGLTPSADDTAPQQTGEPECIGEQPADTAPDHGRGVVRTITDRRTGLPVADRRAAPLAPCPTPAGPDGQAATVSTVKPPPPTGEQLVALTASGDYSAPVLHRLNQLRARGDVPAGRSTHLDPRPA